jgi:NAD(P)-dependent dehydrogenase (short-subunit alcohol dehydrogenase family)
MGQLDGKVAIITGGASGMGAASARLFVAEGARVLIADFNEDNGAAVAAGLGDAAAFRRVDVSREKDVSAAVADAMERWGRLDVMFNNAGFGGARGPIETISEEDFDITNDVLVKGVFFGIKHAAPVMKAAGRGGSIINTASVAGLKAGEAPHLYTMAKAAVMHLTTSVALELGADRIRVNAICPGVIATPLAAGRPGASDDQIDRMREKFGRFQPIGRIGEPEDIAHAAIYLASDASSFVTGTHLVVDGGANAGRAWWRQHAISTKAGPITLYRPPGR